jgi:hypothetical protein
MLRSFHTLLPSAACGTAMERRMLADERQDAIADPTCCKAWEAIKDGDVSGLEMLLTSAEVRTSFCRPLFPRPADDVELP